MDSGLETEAEKCDVPPADAPAPILSIYMATYFKVYLNVSSNIIFVVNSINVIIFAVATLVGGWMSDQGYSKKIIAYPCIMLMLISYPLFMKMQLDSVWLIFYAQALLAIVFGLFFGGLPAIFMKVFSPEVRLSDFEWF